MLKTENTHLVLFPQLLGVYKFDKHEELKKEIRNQVSIYKGTEYEQTNDSQGIIHYFNEFDQNFFDDQPTKSGVIEDFRAFVIRRTNQYADECGLKHPGFFISDAWINVSGKNSFQFPHNHGNSFLSATYYVSYDPEKHPPIEFRNPNCFKTSQFLAMERIERKNHVFGEGYECDWLEEGMLLIWQSGLHHAYPRNPHDDRVSISMNMFPRTLKCGAYGVNMS